MYEQFPEVMNMLWTRMLKDNKKNWRRVYKVSFRVCLCWIGAAHVCICYSHTCDTMLLIVVKVSFIIIHLMLTMFLIN